jgi:hypothetical protein
MGFVGSQQLADHCIHEIGSFRFADLAGDTSLITLFGFLVNAAKPVSEV